MTRYGCGGGGEVGNSGRQGDREGEDTHVGLDTAQPRHEEHVEEEADDDHPEPK